MAEVLPNAEPRVLLQFNPLKDSLEVVNEPLAIAETLRLYTGMSKQDIYADMQSKISILKWMVNKNINDVNKIGMLMSNYYRNRPFMQVKGIIKK